MRNVVIGPGLELALDFDFRAVMTAARDERVAPRRPVVVGGCGTAVCMDRGIHDRVCGRFTYRRPHDNMISV